jgi:hypothetical protein
MGKCVLAGHGRRRFPGYSYNEGISFLAYLLSACLALMVVRPAFGTVYNAFYYLLTAG